MKKIIISALALVMAATVPVVSQAQTFRSEARENRQEHRIYRGAVRGELTRKEMRQIQRQQHRIDRAQSRAARDGYVTRRERQKIESMQDRASRNIYRKTHNGRYVY
ncbi:hypothetical protein JNB91_28830 [Rhizobium wenxiniae]|uniref:hypothetical protein n=1 Tax=Rhizobium wenxiniae TaxID=1737357 RepID=UPI001C6F4431|nr:hypothetical protein [Rhizobium wenxiniae]MBW9091790.1 hypothetical protein [Rhizobium wenxiniae]